MKNYDSEKLRTIAVIGHGSVGKTSLCDALLFSGGGVERLGSVDNGSSHFDYTAESRDRKHSLSSSMGIIEHEGYKINLIDTPGLADFYGATIGGITVSDGVVLVVDGTDGVEVGTLKTWDFAARNRKPMLIWVNRVNRDNADFGRVLENMRDSLGKGVIPVTFPLMENGAFKGVVNVLTGKAVDPQGKEMPVPDSASDDLETYRLMLVEAAAETDEKLMESFFENETLSEEEMNKGLRNAVAARSLFPVFSGLAIPPVGQKFLLDSIPDFIPSPTEGPALPATEGDKELALEPRPDGPFVARVFNSRIDTHMGEIVFVRVCSGGIEGTTDISNASRNASERLGNYYFMTGNNRINAEKLVTGDIAAIAKLKSTSTNDTLAQKGCGIILAPIVFPEPVYRVAIAPKDRGHEDKMGQGLSLMAAQDPTLILRNESEIGQTTLSGMGELHLQVMLSRLKESTGVETHTFKPRIAYHETITKKADGSYKHKKQTGGRGQYGHVFIRLEPLPRGEGFVFASEVVGGNVPTNFIPAVEKGVLEAMKSGPISKSKVVDVKAVVYDGSYHPVDSSDMAFKIAANRCFKDVMLNAGPSLLEPVVILEVTVPEEFMGDVMSDLTSRRGRIQGIEAEGAFQVIKASVPEAELFQYTSTLKSLTQARGSFVQSFEGYQPVPREIQEKIMEEARSEEE
ncbi:MAG: elongation factor G [Candidatus Fermentibacteraceae bacterium]|nr:elongation factor G [Candidatus Fermentibacteraceae bacterium]MBN2609601.1 elongation factor G [Candidatus Fermentibacteraceae bacterium]